MEYIKCNLCGNDSTIPLYAININLKESGDLPYEFSIVKCKVCGLIYTNPRLNKSEIHLAYSNDDAVNKKRNKQSNINYHVWRFERRIKEIEKFKLNGKMLDVGCGNGYFLQAAKERGWDCTGVEFSKNNVNFAIENFGLNIIEGDVESIKFEENTFDVVVLNDVIEHLHDPMNTLLEINRILKNEGIVVIFTMDAGSLNAKLTGKRWTFIGPHAHLYYFTKKTLHSIIENSGFNILQSSIYNKDWRAIGYLCLRYKDLIWQLINGNSTDLKFPPFADKRMVYATKINK